VIYAGKTSHKEQIFKNDFDYRSVVFFFFTYFSYPSKCSMICCNQIKKNDRVHLFEVNIVFEKNRKLSKGSKKIP